MKVHLQAGASQFRTLACALMVLIVTGASAANAAQPPKGFRSIDLSSFDTAHENSARQFSVLPTGAQNLHGVPFQIGPRIAITGIESARVGEFFPTEITGIKIGSKAQRIHLLHGTMFADKDGVPVAKIVFHYAHGGTESVRLGYGVHVRAWIAPRLEKRAELFDPNSQVAWSDADDRRGTSSRIFQTAIENPRHDEAIESIDIVSLFSHAAPFVLALSVEGPESTLTPNRAVLSRKPVRDLRDFPDSVYRREISVRVTDGSSGKPAANAVVCLGISDDKESYFFGEAKTDAQGVCRMSYPPQTAVGLSLWAHAAGRAPAIVSESRTNRVKFSGEYALTLKPGATAGGVVKDATGKAVGGAQIVVHKINRISPHHYGRVDYDLVTTSDDGKWTSHSMPDDLSGLSFQITHPDYRSALYVTAGFAPPPTNTSSSSSTVISSSSVTYQRLADGTLVPMSTGRRTTSPRAQTIPQLDTNALTAGRAEMMLQPALLLEGTLADTQGKPVPAAEVIVQRGSSDRKYLRTDDKGHFQTRVGEPGEYTAVIVLRDGFAPMFRNVRTAAKMAPVEIKLEPPRVLHGRVQDRNGRPVSGARVRADDWNGTADLLRFQALTDQDGTFVWRGAPPDQITFYTSKTNYYNSRSSFSGTMNEITLILNRPPGVYGKVYDAETKKPIESFTIVPGRKYSSNEKQIHWERYEGTRGRAGEYSLKMDSYLFQPEARLLVEAIGYEPQISPAFNNPDSYTNDFALKKGKGVSGLVLLPDGSPAIAAQLILVERGEYAYLDATGQVRGNGSSSSSGDMARTDTKGHFEFPSKLEPDRIFVSHEQGFAQAKVSDVKQSGKITLEKWGRVKGVMRVGDKVEPDETVRLMSMGEQQIFVDNESRPSTFSFSAKSEPDGDGSFVFEKVPAGEHRIALEYRFKDENYGEAPLSHGFPVAVKSGETVDVTLGGTGRQVVGRAKILGGEQSDIDWKRDVHKLVLVLPGDAARNARAAQPQSPLVFLGGLIPGVNQPMPPEEIRERERTARQYVLLFDTNGNFRADNVPPGKYNVLISPTDPEDEYYNRRPIGNLMKEVTVPDEKNAKVNAPFDIGTLDLTIRPRLKIGKVVAPFEAKTRDGKTIKLSDFRGKPVLMHFWGLSLGYSTYDMQVLKEFQSSYGSDGKLVIIGYNLDADADGAEQFAKRQGMTWTQTYLGQWDQTPIPGMFGINGNSACVLVDAEGKLASGQLRGTAIRNTVNRLFAVELE